MFGSISRYYILETSTYVGVDGKHISFKKRRFLPNGNLMPILVELKLKQGERLDIITARSLGDPEQYWRVCDANNINNPKELTEEVGRSIRIPIPQA